MADDKQDMNSPETDTGLSSDPYDIAAAGTALAIGADCLERMAVAFESSARRWELIVFPAMFAFIILAGYGFYLIYSLTTDVAYLTRTVDRNITILASELQSISGNVSSLSLDIHRVAGHMENMSGDVYAISTQIQTLEPMLSTMDTMTRSVQQMNVSTHLIRGDMSHLNHSIGRPMNMMNSFFPW